MAVADTEAQRDAQGRWLSGCRSPNPAGRKPRATELEYLEVAREVVPLERFARILDKHASLAERGNVHSFNTLIKLMGLDIQRLEQRHDGEVAITVVYERKALPERTPEVT